MRDFLNRILMTCNTAVANAGMTLKAHKKAFSFTYMFAMLFSCLGMTAAFASDPTDFALWQTTRAVLNIIYPVFVVVGILMVIIGIILLFVNRFNEQSMTGPLIIMVVGVALIVIRALLGNVISTIAFNQMYPDHKLTPDQVQEIIKTGTFTK